MIKIAAFRIPIKFDPTPVMYLVLMEKMVKKYAELIQIQTHGVIRGTN